MLIDALNNITGSSDLYTSAVPEPFTYIPSDMSAVALADGSITSSFLALFGRSARATGMEGERDQRACLDPVAAHAEFGHDPGQASERPEARGDALRGRQVRSEIAERLYLTILSRFPTDADVKAVEEYAKTGVTQGRDVWIDLAWALINSPEFLLRH